MLGFAVLGVISVGGIQQTQSTEGQPIRGGIYREAIVTSSPRELENSIQALTHLGLVRRNDQGELVSGLAEAWQINGTATQVTLKLRPEVQAGQLVEILDQQTEAGYWDDAVYEAVDGQTLIFITSQPWSTYVYELATPIFPFGPYTIKKTDSTGEVQLMRNPVAVYPPYLDEIRLVPFLDSRAVDRPIRKSQVDGLFTSVALEIDLPTSWRMSQPQLEGEFVLFLNSKQEKLADREVRRQLLDPDASLTGQTFRLIVPEIAVLLDLATEFQEQVHARGGELVIEQYPVLTIKRILQERDYDLVLLGIDYGPGHDLYPYWHSSQIAAPGQNFAGFRDKEIDRLLDEMRFHQDSTERKLRRERIHTILEEQAVMKSFGSPTVTLARSQEVQGSLPDQLTDVQERWALVDTWYSRQRTNPLE